MSCRSGRGRILAALAVCMLLAALLLTFLSSMTASAADQMLPLAQATPTPFPGVGVVNVPFPDWTAEQRPGGLLPEFQFPARVDLLVAISGFIVCVGPVVILLLIIALVRTGRRPQLAEIPEEVGPAEIRRCPECGRMIARPGERFCIECGARLPR